MKLSSRWIYLSPHLDDAVLSCGGLISRQIRNGCQVEIWTIFAGDPPEGDLTPFAQSLHDRWQSGVDSTQTRRLEDIAACGILQAVYRHFDYPDCIYRLDETGRPVISREDDLFRPAYQGEPELVRGLVERLKQELPRAAGVVAPYGFGNHIDHQLVRRLAGMLEGSKWMYADYPYSAADALNLQKWLDGTNGGYQLPIIQNDLEKWQEAVAAYKSQLSTFWRSLEEMRQKIAEYSLTGAGSLLHPL